MKMYIRQQNDPKAVERVGQSWQPHLLPLENQLSLQRHSIARYCTAKASGHLEPGILLSVYRQKFNYFLRVIEVAHFGFAIRQ
jgi:hypothetical protein